LEGLDDVEVLCLNLLVLGEVVILLCDADALAEEVLVDLLAVSLWDKPVIVSYDSSFNCASVHTFWRYLSGLGGGFGDFEAAASNIESGTHF